MKFGEHVTVTHQAIRLYGKVRHPELPDGEATRGWQPLRTDTSRIAVVEASQGNQFFTTENMDWPGEPLPDASDLPTTLGDFARVRRFPLAAHGIVVGSTWRTEGQRFEGGTSGGWDGPEEYDPPYFVESRRVPVLQVALDPVTGPARIVFAVPEDVQLIAGQVAA